MTRTRKLAVWLAACLLAVAAGRAGFADEAIPSERRLPKNVVAFMSLRNVSDFKAQWSKTLFGQLERDDSLADFRSDVEKQLAEASQSLEDRMGLSLDDLLSIPHGEIAAAAINGPGAKPAAVLFLDFGEHEEPLQKLLAKAAESAENDGVKRSEEEIEDTRVIVFQKPAEDVEKKSQELGAYFLKDTFLVLGTDLTAIKAVLSRWDGKHDRTLAENEVYRYILEKCRDENADSAPQLNWFIDPVAMVQALVEVPQAQVAGQMGQILAAVPAMIPILGFDKFRGMGGTFDIARGDYDMVSRTLVCLDRPSKGVVNLIQFDQKAQAPPKWLSTDWSGYTGLNWNVGKAYTAVEGFVDMFQGPGTLAQMIQGLADNENVGGIHLKKDVLDQITGTVHLAHDDAGEKEDAADAFLVAVELKNVAAFRATLAKVARIPGVKIKEREFQGEMIYEIEGGGGADDDDDDDGDGDEKQFSMTIAESHLMVASRVRLLERVLRGVADRETLAESAAYKRIARQFPVQTAMISFSRQDTQLKQFLEVLKGGHAGLPEGALGSFDFSKLPDIQALKKYMPVSGGFMERDERGLKITSFSLRNSAE